MNRRGFLGLLAAAGGREITTVEVADGYAADAVAWNVALDEGEIRQLADGWHPLTIRPDAIVASARIRVTPR